MKTLILNASPRAHGDTAVLVDALARRLKGEVRILTPQSGIHPCTDCRYCWKQPGCAIRDAMQEVYPYLTDCDHVVLASPVWFSSLSGPLLDMASRFQTLFAARHFRGEPPALREKNGVLILVGGEPGTEIGPAQNARTILRLMGARRPCAAEIYSMDTDRIPAAEDLQALAAVEAAARLLNGEES